MIHGQNDYEKVLTTPQSVATNATATGEIDTRGYNYAIFTVIRDSAADVTNKPTTLKIEEGDTTSSYSAITALTGGSSTGNFTIPAASTNSAQLYRICVDLKGRKRYLKTSLTSGGAANISAITCRLTRAVETPVTTAGANLALLVTA